jgi:hypothetical protein
LVHNQATSRRTRPLAADLPSRAAAAAVVEVYLVVEVRAARTFRQPICLQHSSRPVRGVEGVASMSRHANSSLKALSEQEKTAAKDRMAEVVGNAFEGVERELNLCLPSGVNI